MKNQQLFPGIILVGLGVYFFLQQSGIALFIGFFSWQTLMTLIGIAFLAQGYLAKEYDAILPGVILVGLGIHPYTARFPAIYNNQAGYLILIIALGLLLRYQKNHNGLFQTTLFLILAIFMLFYDKLTSYFGMIQNQATASWKFWPLLLIIAGLFTLYQKKKK